VNARTNLFWNKTKPDEVRKFPEGKDGRLISIIDPDPLKPPESTRKGGAYRTEG